MKDQNVCLMDNTFNGHHLSYLEALKTIDSVRDISKEMKVSLDMKKVISYIKDRSNVIRYAVRQLNNENILHLLYLDNLYTAAPFLTFPKHLKVIGTLHHFPNSRSKEKMLKSFSKKLALIIVHSEYTAKQLEALQIRNYQVIDYPSFHSITGILRREELRAQEGIAEDKVVISALGGTRLDKGLDFLLEALSYLSDSHKQKLIINIAGKEETFKRDYITTKLDKAGVQARVQLKLLSDEEFGDNVELSDAIILPYRRMFTGNSGPMTEGVNHNRAIIGADHGNLGFLINQYKLGYTFESENVQSLADTIERFIDEGWNVSQESMAYQDRLKMSSFIESHRQLYKQWR